MSDALKYFSFNFLGGEEPINETKSFVSSLCQAYGEDMILSYMRDKRDIIHKRSFNSQMHLLNFFKKMVSTEIYQYQQNLKLEAQIERASENTQSTYMPDYRPPKKEVRELDVFGIR